MRIVVLSLLAISLLPLSTSAAGDTAQYKTVDWSFDGVTGTFDRPSIQRGYQVYKEVCASCHSMDLIAFRNLVQVGFSEEEAKALAAESTMMDGPDEAGDMFERPGKIFDYFPAPFANEQAARASNGGAYPPDLSLIVKARMDGANYVYSLLTGYEDAPEGMDVGALHYNPYFPGTKIAMASPLSDDMVEYQDGTAATVDQMSKDVVNFLQWTAEPEMEERKQMGIKTLLFLFGFTLLFYIAKIRVWRDVK